MGFVDQTEILLAYAVLAKLDIPPRYDQVGQGEEALHPLQGVADVGPLHGDGLEYCPGANTSHRNRFSRFQQHHPVLSKVDDVGDHYPAGRQGSAYVHGVCVWYLGQLSNQKHDFLYRRLYCSFICSK